MDTPIKFRVYERSNYTLSSEQRMAGETFPVFFIFYLTTVIAVF